MQIFFAVLLLCLGLLFTAWGGDSFVTAAARISEIFAVPKFIIGATVVAVATTLPELIVSLIAASKGKTDMAVSGAIGSVTANTGLILALSAIFMPARAEGSRFKFILLIASVAVLLLGSLSGRLSPFASLLLFIAFAVFIFENIRSVKSQKEEPKTPSAGFLFSVVSFLLGAAGIVIGARLLVDNAAALARIFGISEAVIAVTVLAVGTSLPELTTTLCAIRRGESSLSVGNILGANIIDITIILPACSLLSGAPVLLGKQTLFFALPACLLIICIAAAPVLRHGSLKRSHGFLMLFAYLFYIIFTIISG